MISAKLIHGSDDDYRYHDLPAQCSYAHTAPAGDCWKDFNDNVARMMTIDNILALTLGT